MRFSFRDIATGIIVVGGALAVMWLFMIRPYNGDWQPGGEVSGTIKTLMSNSNVIGGAYINAVITLDTGRQVIVQVPLESNIRAGSPVLLSVQHDMNEPERKRYAFIRNLKSKNISN